MANVGKKDPLPNNDFQQFEDRSFEIFGFFSKDKNFTSLVWSALKLNFNNFILNRVKPFLTLKRILLTLFLLFGLLFKEALTNLFNDWIYYKLWPKDNDKDSSKLVYKYAYYLFDQGKLDSSFLLVNGEIEVGNNTHENLNLRGEIYFEKSEFDAAIQDYTLALEDKNESHIYFKRGLSYYLINEINKSVSDYDDAIELNGNNFIYFFHRALSYKSLKRYDDAIKDLRQAIRLNPTFPYNYNNLANIYGIQELPDSAISNYLKTLIFLDSTYLPKESFYSSPINVSLIYNNLGGEYRKINRPDKAIENLLIAYNLDSTNAVLNYQIGAQLDDLGVSEIALRHFKKCLTLDPALIDAHYSLSIVYENLGQLSNAWESINRALEIEPSNAVYLNRRKEIEHAMNIK